MTLLLIVLLQLFLYGIKKSNQIFIEMIREQCFKQMK